MNAAKIGHRHVQRHRATFVLTVNKTGRAGSGSVSSSPSGINCGADCSEPYNSGTSVTLTASAAGGSTFGGLERMQHGFRHDVFGDDECGEDGHRHVQPGDGGATHRPRVSRRRIHLRAPFQRDWRSARDATSSDSSAMGPGRIPRVLVTVSGLADRDSGHCRRRVRVRAAGERHGEVLGIGRVRAAGRRQLRNLRAHSRRGQRPHRRRRPRGRLRTRLRAALERHAAVLGREPRRAARERDDGQSRYRPAGDRERHHRRHRHHDRGLSHLRAARERHACAAGDGTARDSSATGPSRIRPRRWR